MSDYDDALAWLYALEPRGIRLELERMRRACAMAGDPQRGLRFVHVAGTNGKGSVSAMCATALRAAGLRTGMFTSPHLHRFGERVQVDGVPLGDEELVARTEAVRALLSRPGAPELTFFEASTLLAFEAFRGARCEVVVLEVGLGGRLDSTNVVDDADVLATVITGIALDHMAMLGGTLGEIAAEKAGVIRRGVPVVTGAHGEALAVISARAAELAAPLLTLPGMLSLGSGDGDALTLAVDARAPVAGGARVDGLVPTLRGVHQPGNAALAVAALLVARARGLAIDDDAIRKGVADVVWPARLELVSTADGEVLFDAAHNAEGAAMLAHALATDGPRRRVLVFGASQDKDHAAMLGVLSREVDALVYTRASIGRATPPPALAAIVPGDVREDPLDAYRHARALAGADGLVVVAGSFFVLAPIRAALLGLVQEPPIAM